MQNPGLAGSEFGKRKGPNPSLADLDFSENTRMNPGPEFGFRVWRKEQAQPWFGRLGVRRKNLAKPWFGLWVRSLAGTLVLVGTEVGERNRLNLVEQVQSSKKECGQP